MRVILPHQCVPLAVRTPIWALTLILAILSTFPESWPRLAADDVAMAQAKPGRQGTVIRRFGMWGEQPIVLADRIYEIDVSASKLRLVNCAGIGEIGSIATYGDRLAILHKVDHAIWLRIVRRGHANVVDVRAPDTLAGLDSSQELLVDSSRVFIISKSVLHCYSDGWKEIQLRSSAAESRVPEWPCRRGHICASGITGNTLYLAYDCGEFGASLAAIDVRTGDFRSISATWAKDRRVPVTSIVPDKYRQVWVSQGSNYLGSQQGLVRHLREGEWTTVVDTGALQQQELPADREVPAWTLGPTAISLIDFDPTGRLCLLTKGTGIVRSDKDSWVVLTPTVSEELDNAIGFRMLTKDSAIVAWRYAGVDVWNGSTGTVVRIGFD